jgi:hypothetical protein
MYVYFNSFSLIKSSLKEIKYSNKIQVGYWILCNVTSCIIEAVEAVSNPFEELLEFDYQDSPEVHKGERLEQQAF